MSLSISNPTRYAEGLQVIDSTSDPELVSATPHCLALFKVLPNAMNNSRSRRKPPKPSRLWQQRNG
jgi:hypothetical protein